MKKTFVIIAIVLMSAGLVTIAIKDVPFWVSLICAFLACGITTGLLLAEREDRKLATKYSQQKDRYGSREPAEDGPRAA